MWTLQTKWNCTFVHLALQKMSYFLYSGRVVLKLASVLLLQEHINKSKRFRGTVNAKLSLFKTTHFKQDLKPSKKHENKVSVLKFDVLLNWITTIKA